MNISSVNIRNGRPSDHPKVLSVILEWWEGRDLRSNAKRVFFDHFSDTIFIAEVNNDLVGFIIGFLSQSKPKEAYIHLVGVRPDMRELGLGSLLYINFIEACHRYGRSIFQCCTSIMNKKSIEFHQRIGFSIEPGEGIIDGIPVSYSYYGQDSPMVLFRKEVPKS